MLKKSLFCGLCIWGASWLAACSNDTVRGNEAVLPGCYQMERYVPQLVGKRVGLVANRASCVAGQHLMDTLSELGIQVVKVFSPEHGFSGTYEAGEEVASDSVVNRPQFQLVSLYGKRRKPSAEDLQGVDVMVFDLQDVGVRFYTYISTLHYVMEACSEHGLALMVLDRPNPNGYYVDGPVLEKDCKSFVGMHPVPMVYGLSIGEYACMINGEHWLSDSSQCKLQVVTCKNYDHTTRYALPVAPSPNLPDMSAVYWYPSTCLFEGTVVSEGRGTEAPFRILGHPDYPLHDFQFTPHVIEGASLTPKFKDQLCYGLDLRKIPLDTLQQFRTIQLEYLLNFYQALAVGEDFFTDYINLLAGTKSFRRQVVAGWTAEQIRASWKEGLEGYKKIRANYLLYPDFKE